MSKLGAQKEESRFACREFTVGELNAIVKRLGGPEMARHFLAGRMKVRPKEIHIDLSRPSAQKILSEGLEVYAHSEHVGTSQGSFAWNLIDECFVGVIVHGFPTKGEEDLNRQCVEFFKKYPVMNINVRDALMEHVEHLPDFFTTHNSPVYCFPGTLCRTACDSNELWVPDIHVGGKSVNTFIAGYTPLSNVVGNRRYIMVTAKE